jgi:glycosyltransferase involved in cell wall biosynthesis
MGDQVHVLTAAWGELPRESVDQGVTIHRVPALRQRPDRCSVPEMVAFMAAASTHVAALARTRSLEAALAFFTLPSAPVAWWLKRRRGVPYAISLQGGDVPGFTPDQLKTWHALTGGLIRALWNDAGAVVANSDGLAALARAHAPGQTIDVIPAGVVMDTGTAKIDYDGAHTINLLFAGRLVKQKGIDVLLDALSLLPHDERWTLSLAGDGPEWTALAAQAARNGVFDRLKFLGWNTKEALAGIYRSADIFVLPSRDEGMSNALLEAMATGLPVICTDVAGMRDVVVDGETGLIVPPEHPPSLLAALITLIEDSGLRARMGRAARSHVNRQFSWTRAARSWRTILHRLADQRARP